MSDPISVIGVCKEITERGEWVSFSISVEGKQYPVKIDTKHPAVIASGRAAGSNVMEWFYTESQGAENPNRPGTHYTNRRFEKVQAAPAGTKAPTASGSGGVRVEGDADRSRSIERQVIVKSAIGLYPTGSITTDEQFFALLVRLDTFMQGGYDKPVAAQPAAAADDMPPPHTDDDIPF